jgi:FkbM family methyltransferase
MSPRTERILATGGRAIVSSPAGPAALGLARSLLRKPDPHRLAGTLAWYLGEGLAQRGEPVLGRLATGSQIWLDPRDYGHRHVYFHGTYEEETTALFHRLARPSWTVIDVGANAGYFTLLARDLGGQGSVIHAFEPSPWPASLLERTLTLRPGEVTLRRAACAGTVGEVTFYVSHDRVNTGLGSLVSGFTSGPTAVRVSCLRLDEYCSEHGLVPDLVKIDAEGAESEVVQGMRGLLEQGVPAYVVCEVAPDPRRSDPGDLIAHFADLGYDARRIGEHGELETIDSPRFENICFLRGRAT